MAFKFSGARQARPHGGRDRPAALVAPV